MILMVVIITILYLGLVGSFVYGFDKVKRFTLEDIAPKSKFSIIIPFRDEAENLPSLLKSIAALNYPSHLYEVLLVNDESTDHSVNIINQFSNTNETLNIQVIPNIRMSLSPKKDAITIAVQHAQHNWIITSDADCTVPMYWLDIIDCFIQKNTCRLIVAPVSYHRVNSFLDRYQHVDFMSLQGVTIGSFGIQKPLLCNGANLIYDRAFFDELNGFKGNSTIASGDDMFLLEKALKASPKSVMYLKNKKAIVLTKPQPNLNELMAQRVRWAAKTKSYKTLLPKLVGLLVFIMNALLISLSVFMLLKIISVSLFLYIFIIKTSIDFLLIFKTVRFFGHEKLLPSYILSSILYPFFSVYVTFISVFKGFKWKDRAYSK